MDKINESKINESITNLPEKKFRAGAISATVWCNKIKKKDGTDADVRSVSIQRSYQDKDGEWKNTSSFRTMDIPKATLVLNKAFEHIMMNTYRDSTELV